MRRGGEASLLTGEALQDVLLAVSEDISLEEGFKRLVGRPMKKDEAEDAVLLRLMFKAMPVRDYADIADWIEWSIRERAMIFDKKDPPEGEVLGSGSLHHA